MVASTIDGVLQGGVALLHRDADVDVLVADLEVTVAAAEVQHDQVGIGGQSSLAGGVVGDDDVARTTVQGYQHGGAVSLRGQDVGVLDLRQAGIIPDGAQLARGGGTGQVSHACSIGIALSFFVRVTMEA